MAQPVTNTAQQAADQAATQSQDVTQQAEAASHRQRLVDQKEIIARACRILPRVGDAGIWRKAERSEFCANLSNTSGQRPDLSVFPLKSLHGFSFGHFLSHRV